MNSPFKRLGREVHQRIRPDLQPVALPRCDRRLAAILQHRLAPHTTLEAERLLLLLQLVMAVQLLQTAELRCGAARVGATRTCGHRTAAHQIQDAGSAAARLRATGRRCVGGGETILQHRIVEQMAGLLQGNVLAAIRAGCDLRVRFVEDAVRMGGTTNGLVSTEFET